MSSPEALSSPIVWGPVQFFNDSELVADADEEVFLLYTYLQSHNVSDNEGATDFRGLGHVDSRQDKLAIRFELKPPHPISASSTDTHPASQKRGKRRTKSSSGVTQEKVIEVELAQDKTALRSRKGDTGSVLWKASLDFAQIILQQLYFSSPKSLLNPAKLAGSHILELGAGTGLLSIVLSPFALRYTVTDIDALIPLIQKNIVLNLPANQVSSSDILRPSKQTISVEALDWLHLHSTPPALRSRLFSFEPVDLLLIVDCIYHPSLIPPLISTLNHLTTPHQTAVLVIVELRAEEVIREFLAQWISSGSWEIRRINGHLSMPYVVWVGQKNEQT